jgi:glycosyltransferase involved in cell wall biosynthesis
MKQNRVKQKRDILFLCQYFYPEYISSAELPFDTASRLADEGWKVGALCGYPKEYSLKGKVPGKELVNGIMIRRLKYLQMNRGGVFGRLINYFSFSVTVIFHLFEIRKYRSVIVYSNPPVLPIAGAIAKKLFKTKFIFVAYDIYPEIAIKTGAISRGGIISRLMDKVNKQVYKTADKVIVLSSKMREFVLNNREISGERVAMIPNWYKNEQLGKADAKNNPFYERYCGKLVVSYLGNMGVCQDMYTIQEAMLSLKEEPDVFFMFAGHGHKKMLLKDYIEENKISNAQVLDFLHRDDYLNALTISSCAIVSLADGLTGLCAPSKAYAYMMSGLPVIAIMGDSDIANDVGKHAAGFVIGNGDSGKLVEIILRLKNNRDLIRTMGENARHVYLRKYTTEICTQKYVALFQQILNGVEAL